MREAGNEEGKGSKAMVTMTRVGGKRTATATAMKRLMVTNTILGGAGGGGDQLLRATQQ